MLPTAVLNIIIVGVLAATLLFAVVAGGKVERVGAGILFANVVATFAVDGLVNDAPVSVYLLIDGSAAVAFGVLALKAPERLWPGVAGVAMTFVAVFSASRAIGYPLSGLAYLLAINLSSLLVEAALVAGAWSHRWGRRRTEDEFLYA